MTNVWRTLGIGFGILCFALDILKGLIPTLAARFLIQSRVGECDPQFIWFCVGCAAMVGHCWSIFLGFKGGKAVSCALGTILGTSPFVGLACLSTFVVLLLFTRYVAVSSTLAVASVILYNRIFPNQTVQLLPIFVILTAVVAYRHRANFKRVVQGTEPRVKLPRFLSRPFHKPENDQ